MDAFKIVLFFAVYFLPFAVAELRHKRQAGAIGMLNLLLGWTVLGWIIALVWACVEDAPRPELPLATITPPSADNAHRGSMIDMDVYQELIEARAAWRAKHVG